MTVQEVVRKVSSKVELTEARIVVSGGRGVRSREGFRVLEELADALGGAVGASRGACDAGYCDYALQIGQTGKVAVTDVKEWQKAFDVNFFSLVAFVRNHLKASSSPSIFSL